MANIPKLRLVIDRMEKAASTGTMPAGAKLPSEILKSAGWLDMVRRAIAKLPGRTPQASQFGKQLYRGFPLGAEETGFKGIEHASLHPSVAHVHADNAGGHLHYVLKKFDSDPQVQQHFPHRGLLSSLGFPGRTAEVKADPFGSAFRSTGRTIPEVQQFLKDNPLYHIPEAQVTPANYPNWAQASREHGIKGLGHLGYNQGYEWSTVPAKGWNLFGGQASTKKLFKDLTHETGVHTDNFSGLVSFDPWKNKLADIPHNIAKDLVKGAGVFTASGNKVQGVGFIVPDDVLTKHANLARLGIAAAKSLYGLGSAAVKSPIAQNIATGTSNLVNRAGNLANSAIQSPMVQNIGTSAGNLVNRAGNLANSAMQSQAGKTLVTSAEKLHSGTVDLANRAVQSPIISRLYAGANDLTNAAIQSPMTPDFIKNTFKPGFQAGRQALRRTSREWVPNWDEPSKPFAPGQFKRPESSSPDHVFRQYKILSTPMMPPGTNGVYWNKANQISVRGPKGTERGMRTMRHELTHGLQYQLPSNFSSLQTASVHSPFAGSFFREMNANAAMSRTPLGQIGRAIGYATSPERLQAYWDGYKPIDKLMHGAAVGTAYGAPIAAGLTAGGLSAYEGLHSIAKRMQPTDLHPTDLHPTDFHHTPEFAQAEPPNLTKGAGVFTASGNKVQGVGLRKLYHSLLDERGLTGLGVNNEDTGDVELSFDGDEARRREVFKELAARIKAKTSHPVTFAPTTTPQTSTPVKLSNKDAERLNAIHHLAYRMSNMYDPTHPLMDPNDTFKQKLADRFRLQVNRQGVEGTVPSRAAEQLLGTRPMYAGMMPARRTRSEAEAVSDMPMTQQQRLFKALKSGRGFLAPAVAITAIGQRK